MSDATIDVPARLRATIDLLDDVECTRRGRDCDIHDDNDLCPPCSVALELDRLHRDLTGRWA